MGLAAAPFWIAGGVGAQQVRTIGPSPHVVRAAEGQVRLWIPLELSGGFAPDSVDLVDVSLEGFREALIRDAVVPGVDTDGGVWGLTIDLDLASLERVGRRPDTLAIALRLWDDTLAVPLSVGVLRPAATLADPGTLRFEHVGGDSGTRTLELRETTGLSRLQGVTVTSGLFRGEASELVDVRIDALSLDSSIAAGGSGTVVLGVRGDPHPGRAEGAVLIDAPQLRAPLQIDVVVVARGSRWGLLLLIVVGLGLGFLTREVLQKAQARGLARASAGEVLRAFERARSTRRDEAYHAALDAAAARLRSEAGKRDPVRIRDAVEVANQALNGATETLGQRLLTASERLKALSSAVVPPWQVPNDIGGSLTAVRGALEPVRVAIRSSDATTADALMEALERKLFVEVRDHLTAWRSALLGSMSRFADPGGGVPASVRRSLEAEGARLRLRVAGIVGPSSGAVDVGALIEVLSAVELVRRELHQLGMDAFLGAQAVLGQVVDILGDHADVSTREVLEAALAAGAPAGIDDVEEALASLVARELGQRWRDFVTASALAGSDADQVVGHLDAGEILLAATAAVSTPVSRQRPPPARMAASVVHSRGQRSVTVVADVHAPAAPVTNVSLPDFSHWREVDGPRILQFLIFAVIIAVSGLLILQGDYHGGLDDGLKAFLWGFSLDVTASVVTQQIQAART